MTSRLMLSPYDEERFHRLQEGGEAFDFTARQYVDKDAFLEKILSVRRIAMQTFTGNPFFLNPLSMDCLRL